MHVYCLTLKRSIYAYMSDSSTRQLTISKRVADTLKKKADSEYLPQRAGKCGRLPDSLQKIANQLECVKLLYLDHNAIGTEWKEQGKTLIRKEVNSKIKGYAAQDKRKQILDLKTIITFEDVLTKFLACKCKCYYCNENVKILYTTVRDPLQWTLERLDNDMPHTDSNTVIACMKCNLSRRCRSHTKFKDAKDMKIIKKCDN